MRYVNCTGYADVWIERAGTEPLQAERGPVVYASQEVADASEVEGIALLRSYEDFLLGLPEEAPNVRLLVMPEVQLVAGLAGRLDVWTWRYSADHSGQVRVFGLVQRLDVGCLEVTIAAGSDADGKKG